MFGLVVLPVICLTASGHSELCLFTPTSFSFCPFASFTALSSELTPQGGKWFTFKRHQEMKEQVYLELKQTNTSSTSCKMSSKILKVHCTVLRRLDCEDPNMSILYQNMKITKLDLNKIINHFYQKFQKQLSERVCFFPLSRDLQACQEENFSFHKFDTYVYVRF